LFHFEKSRWRYLALPSIAAGATAILFLSARTFYLGLAFIFILYSVFLVYSYFRHTAKGQGVRWIAIAACYAVAFLVYTLVQQAFYANPVAISEVGQRITSDAGIKITLGITCGEVV
jgi:signal transduction histidine kinase